MHTDVHTTRPARERVIDMEKIEDILERLPTIGREGFAPGTADAMKRLGRRFESFRQQLPPLELEEAIAVFALHLNEEEGVSGQTVEQYLCLLQRELEVGGTEVSELSWKRIKRVMRKRATETVRANPLTLEEIERLIRSRRLSMAESGFIACVWLSGQRPGDLIRQSRSDCFLLRREGALEAALWMRGGTKNQSLEEQGTPRVARFRIPRRWEPFVEATFRSSRFMSVNLSQIRKELSELPIRTQHPKLRERYTLYSIRRGALQHLAAAGLSLEEIRSLTRHRQVGALAAYIGGYLNPQSIEGARVSQALWEKVSVPEEFAVVTEAIEERLGDRGPAAEAVEGEEEAEDFSWLEREENLGTPEKTEDAETAESMTTPVKRALRYLMSPIGNWKEGRKLRTGQ